jgi:hypothetical protein
MMRCRRATVVLLFVFSFSISVSMISWVRADDDYWTSKTPMQQPRGGLGVAAVNGKVYAIGGSNVSGLYPPDLNGGFVGTNEEYDPETDSWTVKAAMPEQNLLHWRNSRHRTGRNISLIPDIHQLWSE